MSELVLAQIGCGYWGPNLLRNLVTLQGCRVKWVAEADPERRAYVERTAPGVRVTADWEELVRDPEVDAVVVATPPSTHHQLASALLRAKKHVLVEKPLTLDVGHADELTELARAAGLTLMVGHTFLFNDAVRHIKSLLEQGELGSPIYLSSQRLNLGQVRSDVDVWWNLAPHDLSILLYLRDGLLPASVACHGVRHLRPDVADVAMAVLRWEDGVVAQVHVSWLDPRKVRRLTLVGDRKMLVYDDMANDKLAIYDRGVDRVPAIGTRMDYDTPADFRLLQRSGDVVLPRISMREPLRVEVEHFVECIRSSEEPLTGPAHARDVVRLLAAGARSLDQGGLPVNLEAAP